MIFHCAYCFADRSLRSDMHCVSCGFRVWLDGGRRSCDPCHRWNTGQREIIEDRDLIANLYAAIAERAERDTRPIIYSKEFPLWCDGSPGDTPADDHVTADCAREYLDALRAHLLDYEGDWLATLSLVATIASSRERAAA